MRDDPNALNPKGLTDPREAQDWLPEEAVAALNQEQQIMDRVETPAQSARRLFQENSPAAALSIIHIAMYGSNERLRLDAAKYVTDRVLGRPGDDLLQDGGKDLPLDALIKQMAGAAESYANTNGMGKMGPPPSQTPRPPDEIIGG